MTLGRTLGAVRQLVHAIDCDLDEDCSCEPQPYADAVIRITVPPSRVATVLYIEGERVTRTEFPDVTLDTVDLVPLVSVERVSAYLNMSDQMLEELQRLRQRATETLARARRELGE